MTNKIWLKLYPEGIPHEINVDKYNSIIDLIEESFLKFKDKPAFSCMGKTYTYRQIDAYSMAFAAFLQKNLTLKKGDRIAIMMPNCLQYPIALFGAMRAGLVVVNTNPLYTPREMKHQFNDAGVKAVVIVKNFAHNLTAILPDTPVKQVILTGLGDLLGFPKSALVNFAIKYVKKMIPPYDLPNAVPFNMALREGKKLVLKKPIVNNNEIALLQYTGGTTGLSKGAMLTHQNVLSNMEMISAWMSGGPIRLEEGKEIVITALPLYHIFAFTVNCLSMCRHGAHGVLIVNPRDMKAFIGELKNYKFTLMTGVNTLFNGLMNQEAIKEVDFSHLKITVGGGMAVQKVVADKWHTLTGCTLSEGYGLTEASPVLTINPLDGSGKIGSIGLPIPSTEIRIVNDEGEDVPVGERGEIIAKGPQIMKGYFNRPEATKEVVKEGWLYTGDIGVMDEEGYIYIVDRKKDMILVSGFNVFPNEVEEVIAAHPGVLEVAVIGVPDDKSTEAVKAFIVKKDDALTEEAIRTYCTENLTGYKKPKFIEFRNDLPKTNVGKILRRALKEEI
jgi:long-chain acyl-CoA synthetase